MLLSKGTQNECRNMKSTLTEEMCTPTNRCYVERSVLSIHRNMVGKLQSTKTKIELQYLVHRGLSGLVSFLPSIDLRWFRRLGRALRAAPMRLRVALLGQL